MHLTERDSESVIGRAAAAAAAVGQSTLPPPQLPPATRDLYAAVFPALACRLALLPSPVRTHSELVPGCLSAPAGLVAPVFCNVVGVEALLAWEALVQERLMRAAAVASAAALAPCRPLEGPVAGPMASVLGFPGASGGSAMPFTGAAGGSILGFGMGQPPGLMMGSAADCSGVGIVRAALEMFCDMAQEAASRHGGYVVASSADGGHWVLVFGCAEAAVGWGLDMLQAMLTAEWPDGFLEHELTEEAWEGEATGQALCGRATDCAVGSRSLGLLFVTSHRRAAREARSASSHRCGLRPGHGASGAPQRPTGLRGKTHEPGSAHRGQGKGGVGECPGGLGFGVGGGRGQGNGRERQYRYPDCNRHVIPPYGDRSCW